MIMEPLVIYVYLDWKIRNNIKKEESKDKRRKPKVKDTEIVVMYRQYDGYPSGHGIELAEFLAKGRLVNGISAVEKELVFNNN